jgi:heme/copper-type cytochrome/quinol oxidase subunit 2
MGNLTKRDVATIIFLVVFIAGCIYGAYTNFSEAKKAETKPEKAKYGVYGTVCILAIVIPIILLVYYSFY